VAVRFRLRALLAAGLIALAGLASAGEIPSPQGEAILVVSGSISNTNDGGVARFDRAMLESLGMVRLTTLTPWHDSPSEYEGVSMRALLTFVGASGSEVLAIALNDYRSAIPLSDFEEFDVVLALKRDGALMPIRDKGPLFIVYPFDSDPRLRTEQYYSHAVWQVKELNVR
jgi:hypothetical protein